MQLKSQAKSGRRSLNVSPTQKKKNTRFNRASQMTSLGMFQKLHDKRGFISEHFDTFCDLFERATHRVALLVVVAIVVAALDFVFADLDFHELALLLVHNITLFDVLADVMPDIEALLNRNFLADFLRHFLADLLLLTLGLVHDEALVLAHLLFLASEQTTAIVRFGKGVRERKGVVSGRTSIGSGRSLATARIRRRGGRGTVASARKGTASCERSAVIVIAFRLPVTHFVTFLHWNFLAVVDILADVLLDVLALHFFDHFAFDFFDFITFRNDLANMLRNDLAIIHKLFHAKLRIINTELIIRTLIKAHRYLLHTALERPLALAATSVADPVDAFVVTVRNHALGEDGQGDEEQRRRQLHGHAVESRGLKFITRTERKGERRTSG